MAGKEGITGETLQIAPFRPLASAGPVALPCYMLPRFPLPCSGPGNRSVIPSNPFQSFLKMFPKLPKGCE